MLKNNNFIKKISGFLYKPIFFSNISKKDGVISLISIIIYTVLHTLLVIYTDKNKIFIVGGIFNLIFCCIVIILNIKKLHTIGFRKNNIKLTLVALIIIVITSLIKNIPQISAGELKLYDFIFNAVSYLTMVGFAEELIFRGYLWPRLVILFGKHIGTLMCGILFGFMHLIPEYKYNGMSINLLNVFNMLWSGVTGQYLFMIIYSFSENIFFSSIIHAAPHFGVVRRTLKGTFNILKSLLN